MKVLAAVIQFGVVSFISPSFGPDRKSKSWFLVNFTFFVSSHLVSSGPVNIVLILFKKGFNTVSISNFISIQLEAEVRYSMQR